MGEGGMDRPRRRQFEDRCAKLHEKVQTDLYVGLSIVRLHVVVQRAIRVEQLLAGLDWTVGHSHVRVSPV